MPFDSTLSQAQRRAEERRRRPPRNVKPVVHNLSESERMFDAAGIASELRASDGSDPNAGDNRNDVSGGGGNDASHRSGRSGRTSRSGRSGRSGVSKNDNSRSGRSGDAPLEAGEDTAQRGSGSTAPKNPFFDDGDDDDDKNDGGLLSAQDIEEWHEASQGTASLDNKSIDNKSISSKGSWSLNNNNSKDGDGSMQQSQHSWRLGWSGRSRKADDNMASREASPSTGGSKRSDGGQGQRRDDSSLSTGGSKRSLGASGVSRRSEKTPDDEDKDSFTAEPVSRPLPRRRRRRSSGERDAGLVGSAFTNTTCSSETTRPADNVTRRATAKNCYNLSRAEERSKFMEIMLVSGAAPGSTEGTAGGSREGSVAPGEGGRGENPFGGRGSADAIGEGTNNSDREHSDLDIETFKPRSNAEGPRPSGSDDGHGDSHDNSLQTMQEVMDGTGQNGGRISRMGLAKRGLPFCRKGCCGPCLVKVLGERRTKRRKILLGSWVTLLVLWAVGLMVYFLAFAKDREPERVTAESEDLGNGTNSTIPPLDDDILLPTGGEGIALKLTSGVRFEYLIRCAGVELDRDSCVVANVLDALVGSGDGDSGGGVGIGVGGSAAEGYNVEGFNIRRRRPHKTVPITIGGRTRFLETDDCSTAVPNVTEQELRTHITDAITGCVAAGELADGPTEGRVDDALPGFLAIYAPDGACHKKLCEEPSAPSKMLFGVLLDEAMNCAEAAVTITNQCVMNKALDRVHELMFGRDESGESLGTCEMRRPGFDWASLLASVLKEKEEECSAANAVPAASRDLDEVAAELAAIFAREDCWPAGYSGCELANVDSVGDGNALAQCWASGPNNSDGRYGVPVSTTLANYFGDEYREGQEYVCISYCDSGLSTHGAITPGGVELYAETYPESFASCETDDCNGADACARSPAAPMAGPTMPVPIDPDANFVPDHYSPPAPVSTPGFVDSASGRPDDYNFSTPPDLAPTFSSAPSASSLVPSGAGNGTSSMPNSTAIWNDTMAAANEVANEANVFSSSIVLDLPSDLRFEYLNRCAQADLDKDSCVVSSLITELMEAEEDGSPPAADGGALDAPFGMDPTAINRNVRLGQRRHSAPASTRRGWRSVQADDDCGAGPPSVTEDELRGRIDSAVTQCKLAGRLDPLLGGEAFDGALAGFSRIYDPEGACFRQLCEVRSDPTKVMFDLMFHEAVECAQAGAPDIQPCVMDGSLDRVFEMMFQPNYDTYLGACKQPSYLEWVSALGSALADAQAACSDLGMPMALQDLDGAANDLATVFAARDCWPGIKGDCKENAAAVPPPETPPADLAWDSTTSPAASPNSLPADGTPPNESDNPKTATVPAGFYDDYNWEDLPPEVQDAAAMLGYDQLMWDSAGVAWSEEYGWDDFSPKQQEAAALLGYDKYSWDGIDPETGLTLPAADDN